MGVVEGGVYAGISLAGGTADEATKFWKLFNC